MEMTPETPGLPAAPDLPGAPDTLDALYGTALPAGGRGGVQPIERRAVPASLCQLTVAGADILRHYMQMVERENQLGRVMMHRAYMLWLIDAEGRLWFALEEVVDEQSLDLRFVMNLAVDQLPAAAAKLGHPALIGGGPARIGGEIVFARRDGRPIWFLSNKSGRYGIVPGRTSAHLDRARALFQSMGIDLVPHFIPPPRPAGGASS